VANVWHRLGRELQQRVTGLASSVVTSRRLDVIPHDAVYVWRHDGWGCGQWSTRRLINVHEARVVWCAVCLCRPAGRHL